MYRQEAEQAEREGENLCHPSAYNRRQFASLGSGQILPETWTSPLQLLTTTLYKTPNFNTILFFSSVKPTVSHFLDNPSNKTTVRKCF